LCRESGVQLLHHFKFAQLKVALGARAHIHKRVMTAFKWRTE
jgi:hypothetical protein